MTTCESACMTNGSAGHVTTYTTQKADTVQLNDSPEAILRTNGIPTSGVCLRYVLSSLLLNQGQMGPLEDIWPSLETFLVVTTGEGATTGSYWIETRNAAKYPACTGNPPKAKNHLAHSVNAVVEKC